ncbi:DUF501 domain-containing protein [Candidatus Bipolaricaulota bacterium]|nr:DUF501 domain-containing protein [Candidatus Bipolaricaulota bacterium]
MESIPLTDLRVLEQQIGRRPRGVVSIPRRCSYGFPQVARVYPLIDGAPFPTVYWLSCPLLALAVDRLEAAGWVSVLEQQMAEDEKLRRAMRSAHDRYVEQRISLLSERDHLLLGRLGVAGSVTERGIGGIADRNRLKCLHLHVAHELADANPIGRIVLNTL